MDFERTRAKLNVAILLRLGAVFVPAEDIHAIKQAMQIRPVRTLPDARAAICAVNAAENCVAQIVIRPLKSPEFGSSLAVGNGERSKPLNREQIRWRRGWDSNPRRRK